MNIAGLSMSMATAQTATAFGVAMLGKSLDAAEITGGEITEMIDSAAMELSVNPGVGANFDVYI